MTELERAIQMLKEEYERARRLDFVRNPIAYALYNVWKKFDDKRKGVWKE